MIYGASDPFVDEAQDILPKVLLPFLVSKTSILLWSKEKEYKQIRQLLYTKSTTMLLVCLLSSIMLLLLAEALAMPSSTASPLSRRSVTCLAIGASATATWTNEAGESCTFVGVVGSNYGENAVGGEYVTLSSSF